MIKNGICAALLALVTVVPARAEAVLDAASAFAALASTERAAFGAMAPGRLAELSSPAPRTSLFSRRAPAEPEMPTEVWIAKQPAATGGAEWRCLTQALYFEARGEGFEGVVGVAEVILNRVESPRFPDSVCAVVNQGTGQQNACQFSFACDGRPEHVSETRTYEHLGKIARAMIDGAPRMFTGGATYFHTTGVNPRWAMTLDQTTQIGDHKFYR